jgi:hypothetical protein
MQTTVVGMPFARLHAQAGGGETCQPAAALVMTESERDLVDRRNLINKTTMGFRRRAEVAPTFVQD